jgi:hypothetical protein
MPCRCNCGPDLQKRNEQGEGTEETKSDPMADRATRKEFHRVAFRLSSELISIPRYD